MHFFSQSAQPIETLIPGGCSNFSTVAPYARCIASLQETTARSSKSISRWTRGCVTRHSVCLRTLAAPEQAGAANARLCVQGDRSSDSAALALTRRRPRRCVSSTRPRGEVPLSVTTTTDFLLAQVNLPKGYAYVEFETRADAEKARRRSSSRFSLPRCLDTASLPILAAHIRTPTPTCTDPPAP